MKLSEDKKGIILRVYENEGKKTITKIKFAVPIRNVKLIDFMENEIQDIKVIENDTLTIEINPLRARSLSTRRNQPVIRRLRLLLFLSSSR